MPIFYTLTALGTRTTPELLALYADLHVLLSDPELTDADRVTLRTVLRNIRLVLHRRQPRHLMPGW